MELTLAEADKKGFIVSDVKNPSDNILGLNSEERVRNSLLAGMLILPGKDMECIGGQYNGEAPGFYKTLKVDFQDIPVEILGTDKIEVERLRAADIILPLIGISYELIKAVGISIICYPIVEYIKGKIKIGRKNDTTVSLNMTVIKADNVTAKNVKYEGPVDGLEALETVLEEMLE